MHRRCRGQSCPDKIIHVPVVVTCGHASGVGHKQAWCALGPNFTGETSTGNLMDKPGRGAIVLQLTSDHTLNNYDASKFWFVQVKLYRGK